MNDTRQTLIRAGADLFLRRSYQGTGINEVLKATGIPKGSFYHFFDSKEAFGVAVVRFHTEKLYNRWEKILLDGELMPRERLAVLLSSAAERLEMQDYSGGCPLGVMAQEMAALSEPLRLAVREGIDGCIERLSACICEGRIRGDIAPGIDAATAAECLFYALQGALIAAKATHSTDSVNAVRAMFLERLLPRSRPAPDRIETGMITAEETGS